MAKWSGEHKTKSVANSTDAATTPAWKRVPAGSNLDAGVAAYIERRWAVYTLLSCLLLALFAYLLLVGSAKTPVIMVTGVTYQAPIPPNQWALEDRDALMELNDRTLAIEEVTGGWIGEDADAMAGFRRQLAQHQSLRRGFRTITEPLVVYLSMPGVVDESGAPCLLPPGASPFRSDDWLKVESLVDEIITALPHERPKLLFFDSQRQVANWSLGITYNTFAERLQEYVSQSEAPNLAVIMSADAGQASWASVELRGSVFGRYLQLGLAGAADGEEGDADNEVTLHELVSYLRKEVSGWARSNRGVDQTPVVATSRPNLEFVVAHSIGGRRLAALNREFAGDQIVIPSVTRDEFTELWRGLDQLRALDILRYDPATLGQYENDLLRLERLAYGGKAYSSEAMRTAADLGESLKSALQRANAGALTSPSLIDHWGITNPTDAGSLPRDGFHTVPLQEYFGQSKPSWSARLQRFWQQMSAASGSPKAADLNVDVDLLNASIELAETQLISAAHQQRVQASGTSTSALLAALDRRAQADAHATPRQSDGHPGDERAHYYVRAALKESDELRLLIEDTLFVPSADASERIKRLAKLFSRAEAIRESTTAAFATRDRVCAELPHLMAWSCRPAAAETHEQRLREINELIRHARNNHELAETLGELSYLEPTKATEPQPLIALQGGIEQAQETQLQRFISSCKDLGAAPDGQEALAILKALESPLVPADLRGDLLAHRDRIAKLLHNKHFGDNQARRASTDVQASELILAETLSQAAVSPLLSLLNAEPNEDSSAAVNKLEQHEQDSWAARRALRRLPNLDLKTGSAAEVDSDLAFKLDRLPLSKAEHRLRCVTPFGVATPANDPIAMLRRFDLQQLLLWHAERALDEFWHTATPAAPKSIEELLTPPEQGASRRLPFFAVVARDYLRAAKQVHSPIPPGVGLQVDATEQRIEGLLEASSNGLHIDADSKAVSGVTTEVDVKLKASSPALDFPLPQGVASLRLVDEAERFVDTESTDNEWGQISLPIAENGSVEGVFTEVSGRAKNLTGPWLDASAFFRGRDFRHRFPVNSFGGATVAYEPAVAGRQSVTLLGNQPRPLSVVFILDCSYSMRETLVSENPNDPEQSRMAIAAKALSQMLDELHKRSTVEPPRVGVRFFGHRAAWRKSEDQWVIRRRDRNRSVGGIRYGLQPANDVELVLPLGDFRGEEWGDVSQRLRGVDGWGITPLNLAIEQTLDDFRNEDTEASMSIIVITDGRDDQKQPRGAGYRTIRPTTSEAVRRKWDSINRDIPVFIVGFDIPEGDQQAAVAEFQEIANHTGGGVETTDSGADLIRYLRERLDVNGYLVYGPNGPVTRDTNDDASPIELGRVVDVSGDQAGELPFDLDIAFQSLSAQVSLEGGEALELEVIDDGDAIRSRPYNVLEEARAGLVEGFGGPESNLLFRVHRPSRRGGEVDFRVSIQSSEDVFTARPREVWVEVAPEGTQEAYLFYDREFELQTPTPVVRFSASNWPEGTEWARVRFWCRYDETEPILSAVLLDAVGKELQDIPFVPIDPAPGVSVRVGIEPLSGGHTVIVEERHDADSLGMGAVRVSVDAAGLRASRVSHRFDAKSGIALHQYTFLTDLPARRFAELTTAQVAIGAEVKDRAFQLADPRGLRVRVHEVDDTLLPSSAF